MDALIEALRWYADSTDNKYDEDQSDYNAGRSDAATEAVNIALRFARGTA